jgi:high affinity Mn2+ porin
MRRTLPWLGGPVASPALAFAAWVCLATPTAHAQSSPPGPHEDAAFDFMNLITEHALHNIDEETWNVYGQSTYISSWKPSFQAPYTNANGSNHSLVPDAERGFTWSFTLFFAKSLWKGGEVYYVPEIISERPLSNLTGIGGSIQDFELQKTGSVTPQLYRQQLYLRQTFDLGGENVVTTSQPQQLGRTNRSRRLVLTAGNFTVLDVFDHNAVWDDSHKTFFNMAFMTYSAWDFAADARGYSLGAAAELYWDNWAVRLGRMAPPQNPNVLPIDLRIWKYYADALELEHDHVLFGQPGAIRLLAYRNYEVTGKFSDAISAYDANPLENAGDCPSTSYNYGSGNFTAPDLCWVRKPNQKLGIGINVEQFLAKDIGIYVRAMYSDGQTEVDAFDPADRSLTVGAVAKGTLWRRPFDETGIGVGWSWISKIHQEYLEMGGVDGFVGDGALTPGAEGIFEVFYSVNFFKALWLAADYQLLWNPGFNVVRGPVNIIGAKAHVEF